MNKPNKKKNKMNKTKFTKRKEAHRITKHSQRRGECIPVSQKMKVEVNAPRLVVFPPRTRARHLFLARLHL